MEKQIAEAVAKVKQAGIPAAEINKRVEMTIYQRLEYLLDPRTGCPLHTLFDPLEEKSGTTGVIDGLGRIGGKWKDSGRPLQPTIDKMNALAQDYYNKSRPGYCAETGFVDKVVSFAHICAYRVAFTDSVYQNPRSICPHHHMMIPRIIKG